MGRLWSQVCTMTRLAVYTQRLVWTVITFSQMLLIQGRIHGYTPHNTRPVPGLLHHALHQMVRGFPLGHNCLWHSSMAIDTRTDRRPALPTTSYGEGNRICGPGAQL